MTLRTKHYAGAIEVSVGSGIQRVEEIVDGRSKAKYPVMTIFLNEENCFAFFDNDFIKQLAAKLAYTDYQHQEITPSGDAHEVACDDHI